MIYRLSVLAQRGYLGKCFGKWVCVDWEGALSEPRIALIFADGL